MKVLDSIKSKGYWRVIIRPEVHNPELIPYGELLPIIRKSTVDMRGWDFPHVLDESPKKQINYLELDVEFMFINECWRFYQSGQFIHYSGIFSDWRETKRAVQKQISNANVLEMNDTVGRFTEIFEFASRYSRIIVERGGLEIGITLRGLRDRILVNESSLIGLRGNYKADIGEFSNEKIYSESELTARPRELAAQVAIELFSRFGWIATVANLRAIQERVLRK